VRHFFTSKVKFLVKLQKIIFPLFSHRITLLSHRKQKSRRSNFSGKTWKGVFNFLIIHSVTPSIFIQ
jgi:hypothetical protein